MIEQQTKAVSNELIGIYVDLREDLFRFIYSKIKSAADAEDVVQHLYLQITDMSVEKLASIKDRRNYLFGIANFLALKHLQRQSKSEHIHSLDEYVEESSDDFGDPSRHIASQQTMTVLKKVLDDMPAKRRQVFMYYRYKNMSVEGIAEELGLSVSAVEKHIVRALVQCREQLKGVGL